MDFVLYGTNELLSQPGVRGRIMFIRPMIMAALDKETHENL
jgi:hypothetical protein